VPICRSFNTCIDIANPKSTSTITLQVQNDRIEDATLFVFVQQNASAFKCS